MYTPTMDVEVSDLAQELLTDERRIVLEPLLELIKDDTYYHHIPVTKTLVDGFVYESGQEEMVIRLWTDLPPDTALDYWERLIEVIVAWEKTLPKSQRTIAAKSFAVEVNWNIHDETDPV